MTSRISYVGVGVTLYVALLLLLHGLYTVAFPNGGGPIPLWFASKATTSVLPGFIVGWLSRGNGPMLGAVTGALGSTVGNITQFSLWASPLSVVDAGWPFFVGLVIAVLASTATNAVGGIAGVSVRKKAAL